MRKLIRELIATLLIGFLTGKIIDEIINIPELHNLIPMVCTITSALRKYIVYKMENKKK